MSQSSINETYPASLPSSSKYQFKKLSSQVFARNPWKSNEQQPTNSETLPNFTLPVPTGNVQQEGTCTKCLNMPVNVDSNLMVPVATQNCSTQSYMY